jgi:hypothetical protein
MGSSITTIVSLAVDFPPGCVRLEMSVNIDHATAHSDDTLFHPIAMDKASAEATVNRELRQGVHQV